MSEFKFTGIDRDGRKKQGRIAAENRDNAAVALRAAGVRVMSLDEAADDVPFWQRDLLGSEKPSRKEVIGFFNDLSALLGASLTVDKALRLSLRQATRRMRPVLSRLIESVVAGRALSDSMRTHDGVFDRAAIEIVRAGEVSGALAEVVANIAETMRRQEEMRSAIVSALIYPAILTVMALVIVVVTVSSLLPSIAPLFEAPGVVVPLPIQFLTFMETVIAEDWPLLLAASSVILIAAVAWWRNAAAKASRNRMWRRLPLLGAILTDIDVGRTCRILGTLVTARVPLPQALAVSENIPAGLAFRQTLGAARRSIQEGARLADALQPLHATAPRMIDMIRTGEEVNRLGEMLLRIADLADTAVKTKIDRLFTLLTPLITCFMGLVIGGLIMSIMGAILSVSDLAGAS
jgi:general secretion pathway protein F